MALLTLVMVPSASAEASPSPSDSVSYYPPLPQKEGEQRLLVILVEFQDLNHTLLISAIRNNFLFMQSYYYPLSFNEIYLNTTVDSNWYRTNETIGSFTYGGSGDIYSFYSNFVQEAVALADPNVNYSDYDQVIILHAGSSSYFGGNSLTLTGLNITTMDNCTLDTVAIVGEFDHWIIIAHEYGHILGLPDLYNYAIYSAGGNYSIYAGAWDLMSNDYSYGTPGLTSWNLLRLGWLPATRVATVGPGGNLTVNLNSVDAISSNRYNALKVPLTNTTYYLVEVRLPTSSNLDLLDYGVLVMLVNESIPPGSGPLRIMDSNNLTSTLNDATFDLRKGKVSVFLDQEHNIAIVVNALFISSTGLGFTVSATDYATGQQALAIASFLMDVKEKVTTIPYIYDFFGERSASQVAFDLFASGDYGGAQRQAQQALNIYWFDVILRLTAIIILVTVAILLVVYRKRLSKYYHSFKKRIDPLAYPERSPDGRV